ncbi:MAG: 2-octaprenyl-6-methoxyphenyl hydroxylase [Spongiibacteraceae bacterium]
MTSAPHDCDVLIAGGGMVGVSFALALDTVARGTLKIVMAEGFAIPEQQTLTYRPSFDARATALAHGSRLILEQLGVWNVLAQHASAITTIHVSERDRFGSAELRAEERGWPALGYVVENAWLGNALMAELRTRTAVTVLSPATVTHCAPGADAATVTLTHNGGSQPVQQTVQARLVAIADGADSGLRKQLGIGSDTRGYGRDAVIANIGCSEPHAGVAYERFTDWGPMALLPLADSEDGQPRMALVWTMTPERANRLLDATDGVFLNTLQQRFGSRQGSFTRVGQRFRYPLQLIRAEEQARRQIVLIGNAAHSLHPVAGQGFNLALRDVQRLADIVGNAGTLHEGNVGAPQLLAHYLERQNLDQWKTTLFSDRLTALFENGGAVVGGLRRLGLLALDLNPSLKNAFVDQTSGYHGGAALGYGGKPA